MSTQFSLPVRLNPVINPWLSNHVFQGPKGPSAILPGVAFLQMAADGAASHCPFIPVIKLQNIRFKRLVSVPLDQRKTLFLHHEIDETPEGIRDRVQLKDPEPSEKEPYAEAEVILNTALPVYPSHGNSGLLRRVPQEPHVLRGRLIYESGYFENKGFMAMACAMSVVNPQLALLNFSPFISADLQAQQIACGSVLPLALDMGFEGAGWLDLWHSFQAKETIDGLRSPSFVRSVTYYTARSFLANFSDSESRLKERPLTHPNIP